MFDPPNKTFYKDTERANSLIFVEIEGWRDRKGGRNWEGWKDKERGRAWESRGKEKTGRKGLSLRGGREG